MPIIGIQVEKHKAKELFRLLEILQKYYINDMILDFNDKLESELYELVTTISETPFFRVKHNDV